MYALRCLGETSFRDASGELIHFRSRKHLALLLYLALNHERAHRRERLAALLWSESEDARARHSLSQALYAVRRLLDGTLRIEGEDLELRPDRLWVDAIELETRLKAGDPVGAANLYGGEFLEGFYVRGARGFEDWADRERARIAALARESLRGAIRIARGQCDWSDVCGWSEELVSLDPFDEAAYAEWMRALWLSGDRAAALKCYDRLRDTLDRELGTRPSADVEGLVARIRRRSPRGGWNTGQVVRDAEEPDVFRNPPFVGRKRELALLAAEWERVKLGETRAVALVGEAGIGKTRLAEEFIKTLELDDVLVLRGRCYEAEQSVPYGPIAEALISMLPRIDLRSFHSSYLVELGRIVPNVHAAIPNLLNPPAMRGEGARRRMFDGIAQIIRAACDTQPLIMLVDDLHWADMSSIALLHYLLRYVTNGFLLVTTHRPEELVLSSRSASHLPNVLRYSTSISLDPLNLGEAAQLLGSLVGRSPHHSAERLHASTGGNPFYTIELARGLLEDNESVAFTNLSANVKNSITHRLRKLDHRTLAFLEQAAFLGSHMTDEALQSSIGLSEFEIRELTHAVVQCGLVMQTGHTIIFRHDLLRQFIKQSVEPSRRRRLHIRAARALLATDGQSAEIARHFEAAGDSMRAFAHSLKAAREFEEVFAFTEAAELLEIAVAHAPTHEKRLQVIERLGKLYWHLRMNERARRLLEERLRLANSTDVNPIERWRAERDLIAFYADSNELAPDVCAKKLNKLYKSLARIDQAAPLEEVELLRKVYWAAVRSGDNRLISQTVERARIIYEHIDSPEVRWQVGRTLAIDAWYRCDQGLAERLVRQSLAAASECDDIAGQVDCYVILLLIALRTMRYSLFKETMEHGLSLAQSLGDPGRQAMLFGNAGVFYLYHRDVENAESSLTRAHDLARSGGEYVQNVGVNQFNLGLLALLKEDLVTAKSHFDVALDTNAACGNKQGVIDAFVGRAYVYFLMGELGGARTNLASGLKHARHAGAYIDETSLMEVSRSLLQYAAGKHRRAIDHLAAVARRSANGDRPLYLNALMTKTELLLSKGDMHGAFASAQDLARAAKEVDAKWYLARALELLSSNGGDVSRVLVALQVKSDLAS